MRDESSTARAGGQNLRLDFASSIAKGPFRYAVIPSCMPPAPANRLLSWLEDDAPWRLTRTDFYEQHEFDLRDAGHADARALVRDEALASLREAFENAFGIRFERRVSAVAHRLTRGQRIGIHNDFLAGEETHRLVVQLNRGLTDEDGGFLMLFNSSDPSDVHRILRPTNGSGLAFEISETSFHAVSRMHSGERYTLVFSLYARR